MADGAAPTVRVLGLGNEWRGDDAAGLAAVRLIRERSPQARIDVAEHPGELTALLEAWRCCSGVVLVDAGRGGGPPGTIRRLDASHAPLPALGGDGTSTHAAGLPETIELARALRRLPPRVVVCVIVGACFDPGTALSAPVRAALPALAEVALAEGRRLRAL